MLGGVASGRIELAARLPVAMESADGDRGVPKCLLQDTIITAIMSELKQVLAPEVGRHKSLGGGSGS